MTRETLIPVMMPEMFARQLRAYLESSLDIQVKQDVAAGEAKIAASRVEPTNVILKSGFTFGKTSEKELIGVNADLVRCTRLALDMSTQDFMVFDGIRSVEEQKQHVKNGTSKTMKSKHLDGLAVDLVPWINGKPTWDWDGCYRIAYAMDLAATALGIAHRITWGGAWDRKLSDFGGDLSLYKKEVENYKVRHPGPDFIDGPHFEILP
jgi:peptidoglycan L-alanyl-D-glutamate endopeptidase CwlK